MTHSVRTQLFHYGMAPIVVGLAIVLRILLASWLDAEVYFLFLWPAVILSAWYGGLGPGLFATLLAAAAANWYFLEPVRTFGITSPTELVVVILFVLIGSLISLLSERLHVTRRLLEQRSAELIRQEASLRVILAGIDDAVMATDPDGRVSFLNAAGEVLTGWQENDAMGKPHAEVFRAISEVRWKQVDNPITNVLKQGEPIGLGSHTVLLSKDGQARPVEGRAAPLRDENNKLLGVVLTFQDTTALRLGEEARSHLAAIVTSSEEAIVSRTLDGIVTSWNAGAERLYGYTAEEMIGRPISLLIPNDVASELASVMERIRRGDNVESYETVRLRKDGTRIDVSVSMAPLKNEAGKTVGAAVIARPAGQPRAGGRPASSGR